MPGGKAHPLSIWGPTGRAPDEAHSTRPWRLVAKIGLVHDPHRELLIHKVNQKSKTHSTHVIKTARLLLIP